MELSVQKKISEFKNIYKYRRIYKEGIDSPNYMDVKIGYFETFLIKYNNNVSVILITQLVSYTYH